MSSNTKSHYRTQIYESKPVALTATPSTNAGGTPTAITNFAGSGFVTGAKLSFVNPTTGVETPCTANGFTSATQITATTPVLAAGTYRLVARNPDGAVASIQYILT